MYQDNRNTVKLIGYGSFMEDVLEQMGNGLLPSTWGEPVKVLGPIRVVGYQRLFPGRFYPVVIPSEDHSFIGILFEISESQLTRFDQIEGAPNLYERKSIEITWKGSTTSVFLYVAGLILINTVFGVYENQGKKPGRDDWLDHLQKTISHSAKSVFPEIFED